jgi:ABC-type molybdate transport system substrate-binding protein
MTMRWSPIIVGLVLAFGPVAGTEAAEIKVFTTRAIMTVLEKVGPEFERTTGHTLNLTTDIAIRMVRRIQAGEPFDFLVASPGRSMH